MYPATIKIIGYCTSTSAKIFFSYDSTNLQMKFARIAYKETGGQLKSMDMEVLDASPFCYGVFDLTDFKPGNSVEYNIVLESAKKNLPAPEEISKNLTMWKFRLLPPDRPLKIGVVSCNGVYLVPDYKNKYTLWKELQKQIDDGNVDLIFHVGDQIYADPIWMEHDSDPSNSNKVPNVEELKKKYRDWYFYKSWNSPDILKVLATCPNIMMWDDHDIYDGYGSNDDDDKPAQKAFFTAAKDAFQIFQASHNPSVFSKNSFACGFIQNETGFLVLDGRTNRMYNKHTVLGNDQFSNIQKWLSNECKNLKHLYVIAGIPFVHVKSGALLWIFEHTPWTEELTDDLRDSWVSPNNRNECGRIIMTLFDYKMKNPETGISVLSGDVHVGTLAEITSRSPKHILDGKPTKINQIVSSGIGTPSISNFADLMMRISLGNIDLIDDTITGNLKKMNGVAGAGYYLSNRNFAIVKTGNSSGNEWDKNGNVWVEFFAEEGNPGSAVRKLEQVLLG